MADNDLIRRGDAMREGYRTCAETRHVTLGQKVETAILAIPAAQVTVKPLEWRETNDGNHRKGDIYSARSLVNFAPIAVHKKHDGWWLNVDCKTYPTIEAAKAAAQADYDARIRAALTVTPHNPAKVQALVEALEPFADIAKDHAADAPEWRDNDAVKVVVTIGNLRAARAALAAWNEG